MSVSSSQAVANSSSSTDSATVSAGAVNPASKNLLSMNSFLKMFTTELQYQDPTNPLQSYQLAAQLAQYSSVELLSKIDEGISKQQTLLSSINNAQMMNLIGHEIETSGNGIQMHNGSVSDASYTLASPAANVTLSIFDQNNNLVRTLTKGEQAGGSYSLDWDGRNDAGSTVQDGNYTFKVQAIDAQGNAINADTTIAGVVNALRMDGSNSYLVLGGKDGQEAPINSVTRIFDLKASSSGNEKNGS